MKKMFEGLGILALLCFSFVYTEKTVNVVKDYDDIMIAIKTENDNYKVEYVNATILKNTIIPGISGKEINLNKSYSKMKRYGKFNSNLIEYNETKPEISIKKNYDKYIISGNEKKNMISLIFLVQENDSISKITKILNEKEVKANFFIDSSWLENNNDNLLALIKEGHNIGNLSHNLDYNNSSFAWIDTFIKKIGKQKTSFCYNEQENEDSLQICSLAKNYTIRPNIIVKNYPLKKIKDTVIPGSIISLPINESVEKELSLIINYIKSKGYTISSLENHLSE